MFAWANCAHGNLVAFFCNLIKFGDGIKLICTGQSFRFEEK